MDIKKISYESAELFLSANDKSIPDNIEQLYQEVEQLIEKKDIFIPDEILYWIDAKNIKSKNISLPKYYSHYILVASFDQLIPIAQQLKLTCVNKEQIHQILYFLGTFDDEIAHLENLFDLLPNIFSHLNSKDIINLCNISAKI